MIKAIFFDIDGTLVSFQSHVVPERTKQALLKLKKKGILLFVATGRAKDGLHVLNGISFDAYITLNGQFIYNNEKILYENTIPEKELEIIKEEVTKRHVPCGFEMKTGKIYNFRDERVDEIHAMTQNDNQPSGDITNVHDVYQAQVFVDEQKETEFMKNLPNCISSRWYPTFMDISPKGGTKKNGMDILAKHYGFTMKETMAFGDGGNDKEMIEHAGIGIAMGNAMEELKTIADYITEDVDHDGIGNALRKYQIL